MKYLILVLGAVETLKISLAKASPRRRGDIVSKRQDTFERNLTCTARRRKCRQAFASETRLLFTQDAFERRAT